MNDMSNHSASVNNDALNNENQNNAAFVNFVNSVETLLYNLESTSDNVIRGSQSDINCEVSGDTDCSVLTNSHYNDLFRISNNSIQLPESRIQNQFLRLSYNYNETSQQSLNNYDIQDMRSHHSANNSFEFLPSRAAGYLNLQQSLGGYPNRSRSESDIINMSTQMLAQDTVRTRALDLMVDFRDTSEISSASMIPPSIHEVMRLQKLPQLQKVR